MVKSVCWGVGVVGGFGGAGGGGGRGGGGAMEGNVKLPAAACRCWGYEGAL